MDYQEYIKTELLILIPVLYFVGIGMKKSKIPDKWIPLMLGAIGILLSSIWVIASTSLTGLQEILSAVFSAVTQGVLVAGTSVYANQIYIQAKKEE